MFRNDTPVSSLGSAFRVGELIFHATVRNIRKSHGNAIAGLLLNIAQMVLMVVFFFVIAQLLSRRVPLRGDYLLFLISGVMPFFAHVKVITAVVSTGGPVAPMMKHAPMNTAIAIAAAALAVLYIQVLSVAIILFVYHAAIHPISIHHPVMAFGMYMLAWFYGLSIGVVLLAIKPWSPSVVMMVTMIYRRVSMFASGKMFVANQMPSYILIYFTWNPLFHCIDQTRGAMFINYYPHHSSATYPLWVALTVFVLGMMAEFYTRQRVSASWNAGR